MFFVGTALVVFLVILAIVLAQFFFYRMTGRVFWRAMIPSRARFMLLPNDKVELDSFMVLEEWVAVMFMCSFLLLPIIAINAMGLIHIF